MTIPNTDLHELLDYIFSEHLGVAASINDLAATLQEVGAEMHNFGEAKPLSTIARILAREPYETAPMSIPVTDWKPNYVGPGIPRSPVFGAEPVMASTHTVPGDWHNGATS